MQKAVNFWSFTWNSIFEARPGSMFSTFTCWGSIFLLNKMAIPSLGGFGGGQSGCLEKCYTLYDGKSFYFVWKF